MSILKNHNFGTTEVINIKLASLKSDLKKEEDLCKYIKSDSQLSIYKITLDYQVPVILLKVQVAGYS